MFWKIMHSELRVPVAIPPESVHSQSELSRWLMSWFVEASDDERAVMVQGVYALWLARNNARDGQRIEQAEAIAKRVFYLMGEWQSIHGRTSKQNKPTVVEKWTPPTEGWVKANVDGATAKAGENGGAGMIFRNQDGAYLGGSCHFLPRCNDPARVELQVCWRAVILAEELNIPRLHIKMDCQDIVGKLRSKEKDLSTLGLIVEEVKNKLASREEWKLAWILGDKAHHRIISADLCEEAKQNAWITINQDTAQQSSTALNTSGINDQ
ncbi:uncharacterized protein [Aegilops tauschii subsp. strangulata]|uniref:uncharacterized protein n=1 Tax=Aegilops tauschii subsp. strangulata TaxID=200361 RepID=UPI00098A8B46|nr:uncharacterized protein LOC109778297 [Aegilops tauschii subsp. strangulata]